MRYLILFLLFPAVAIFAQNPYLTTQNDQLRLTPAGASFLAKLPLHCIHTEYYAFKTTKKHSAWES